MSYPRCTLTDDVCIANLTATKGELDLDGWDIDSQGAVVVTGGPDGFRFWNGTDADMGGSLISLADYVLLNGTAAGQLEITNLDFAYDDPAYGTATYVTASDSTVSGSGTDMDASDGTSIDDGGNVRWDFGLSTSSSQSDVTSLSSPSTQTSASSSTCTQSSASSSTSTQSSLSSLSSLSTQSSASSSSTSTLTSLSSKSSSSSSIIYHLPVSVTFTAGGSVSGTVNDARQVNGTYVQALELIQTPGVFIWFEFYEVPNTVDVDVRVVARYADNAGSGKAIDLVVYNWTGFSWDVAKADAFTNSAVDEDKQFGLPDSGDYLFNNRLRVGLRTNGLGALTNQLRIDMIELVEAVSSSSTKSSTSLSSQSTSSSTSTQSSATSESSLSSSSTSTQSSLSSSTSTQSSQTSESSLSSSTSTESTQSSQSSTSSVEEVVIPSGYDLCAGSTVTSDTLTDIPNLSCTVTVPTGGGYVAAFFSAGAQTDATGNAYFAISIDGVDSTEITRNFSAANTPGCVSAVFRSGLLAAGTYTVKGRMRAAVGTTTVTVNTGTLAAIAMATTIGNTIPSGTAAGTDTTTNGTLEDVDGITTSITLTNRNHIVGMLAASTSGSLPVTTITVGVDINGEQATTDRYHGTAGSRGSSGAVLQTLSTAVAGTRTAKAIWSTDRGTATGDFQLVSFGLEDGVDSIDSAFAETGPHSTTSGTLTDITAGLTVELNHAAYVFAACSIEAETSLNNIQGSFRLLFDGTAAPTFVRYFPTLNREGNITIYGRSTTKIGPGTVTVKPQFATNGGTLTVNDLHLFVMALEATPLIFDSSSSSTTSTQSSLSSSSSTSTLSSLTSSTSTLSTASSQSSSTSTLSSLSSSTSTQSAASSQSSQSTLSSTSTLSTASSSTSTQSSLSSTSTASTLSSSSTSTQSTASSQSSSTSTLSSLSSSTTSTQSSQSSSSTGASLSDLSSSTTSTLSSLSSSTSTLSSQSTQSSSTSTLSSQSSRSSSTSSSSSIIFHLPSSYTLTAGTVDSGTLNDTRQPNDVFLRVAEADAAAPGLLAEFYFLEVPDTIDYDLMFRGYYDGEDPDMRMAIYNNLSTAYDDLLSLPFGQAGPTTYRVALPDDPIYLGPGGTLRILFYSPATGNQNHHLFIDWLELVEAISSSSSTSTTLSSQSSQTSTQSSQTSHSSSTSTQSSQSSSTSTSSAATLTELSSSTSSTLTSLSSTSTLSSQTTSLSSQSSQTTSLTSQSTQSSQTTSLSSQTTSLSSSSTSTQSTASSSTSSQSSQSTSTSTSETSQTSSSVSSSSSSSGVGLFPAGATAVQICPSNATSVRRCASAATVTAVCPIGATAALPTV